MTRKFVHVEIPAIDQRSGTQLGDGTKIFLPDGTPIPGVKRVTIEQGAGYVCRATIECYATVGVAKPQGETA